MLLCLENDLGFPDPGFWGQGCNSESGLLLLLGNTTQEEKPRVRNDTYARTLGGPAGHFLLGLLQRGEPGKLFSNCPGHGGRGTARGGGARAERLSENHLP